MSRLTQEEKDLMWKEYVEKQNELNKAFLEVITIKKEAKNNE